MTEYLYKTLCLGSNTESTDQLVSELAANQHSYNHGLIESDQFVPGHAGFYHTSILDISFGGILELAKQFDHVIFLDQTQDEYDHWKPLLSTYKLMLELEKQCNQHSYTVEFRNNANIKRFAEFDHFLETNKSFCIYPWINYVEERGKVQICSRSLTTVTTPDELKSWKHDPKFGAIRQKMLAGETMPETCHTCYEYESRGVESYRQFETKDWLSKLEINSVDDLEKIEHPHYYEIRMSNKCNLMCRGCRPEYSHLIAREARVHNIDYGEKWPSIYASIDRIDIETLSPRVRVYLTGGDPTVMHETLRFMERCIEAGKTDFDFTLGTNLQSLSPKFVRLCKHFSNMNFSVSLDGYGRVNDYWRWRSNWDDIVANMKMVEADGHNISINTVPGIYNVTNLHLLYEWLDKEFPYTTLYLQLNYNEMQSVWNHPNHKMVIESMKRIQQTKTYHADGKSNKTAIDSILAHYSNNPEFNPQMLKQFFEHNDKLDRARGSRLGDYIPELEECRDLIT